MSAIISPCGKYRYRLEREIQPVGPVVALFGINPSTADATVNDQTIRKDIGFAKIHGWSRIIKGNVFAFRATDVNALATCGDPWGEDNFFHVDQIISQADILIPCWGSRAKVPKKPWGSIDRFADRLTGLSKPVLHFGVTSSGDPKHTLMLGYDTKLEPWRQSLQGDTTSRTGGLA